MDSNLLIRHSKLVLNKIFHYISEISAWLKIYLSTTIASAVIACIIYFSFSNTIGLIIAIITLSLGILLGVYLASKINNKEGCANYMGKLHETPDFDFSSTKDNENQPK